MIDNLQIKILIDINIIYLKNCYELIEDKR